VDDGNWPWAASCEPNDLFKPSLILALLLKTHGNALKQLGITVNNLLEMQMCHYYIQRCFKIVHFLDFTALTHLEFDIKVLRFRRGSYYSYPPLAKIIPTDLQELGIIINELNVTSTLYELFEGLPTAGFNNLKNISVRLPLAINRRGEYPNKDAIEILTKFREDFRQENITFGWTAEYATNNVQARLDWKGGNNLSDNLDPVILRRVRPLDRAV